MATIDTGNLISVSEASKLGLSALVRQAETGRERILVRNNRAVAVVMSVDQFEQLQQLQDDLLDITLLTARMMTSAGPSSTLDDVIENFGFTREDLATLPD